MAYTNETIYDNLMTLLRKEKEGKTITEEQFNELLLQCSWEIANFEYSKFERNQTLTDSLRLLKVVEKIYVDYEGKCPISSLLQTYWHPIYLNNNGVKIDICTDNEWNERLGSSLEYPTSDFPISNIKGGYIYTEPIKADIIGPNLVSNSGFEGTTDWVDTNTDGKADGWGIDFTSGIIINDEYGFDGYAQGSSFSATLVSIRTVDNVLKKNCNFYFEFEYYIEGGTGTIELSIWVHGAVKVVDIPVTVGSRVRVNGIFFNNFETLPLGYFNIIFTNSTTEISRNVFIDKVFLSRIENNPELTFSYLKSPDTPYFDYYYDASDQIVYLPENTSYTLQTDEVYIDKDDGTERTSGYTITTAENKTKELFLPEHERYRVLYSMLQKMGVSLNEQDALQYGIVTEQKNDLR